VAEYLGVTKTELLHRLVKWSSGRFKIDDEYIVVEDKPTETSPAFPVKELYDALVKRYPDAMLMGGTIVIPNPYSISGRKVRITAEGVDGEKGILDSIMGGDDLFTSNVKDLVREFLDYFKDSKIDKQKYHGCTVTRRDYEVLKEIEQIIGGRVRGIDVTEEYDVTSISLNSCKLTEVPEPVQKLKHLEALDLGCNQLSDVPAFLQDLPELRGLNLPENPLGTIPNNVLMLNKLEILGLSNVQLGRWPESILALSNLKILDVCGNNISVIPDSIGHLVKLQELNLLSNSFETLPLGLLQTTRLHGLWVEERFKKDPLLKALKKKKIKVAFSKPGVILSLYYDQYPDPDDDFDDDDGDAENG
jgi:hypothetical protein